MLQGYRHWHNLSGRICKHVEQSILLTAINPGRIAGGKNPDILTGCSMQQLCVPDKENNDQNAGVAG